jgi:carboxymethylenebutenolidase
MSAISSEGPSGPFWEVDMLPESSARMDRLGCEVWSLLRSSLLCAVAAFLAPVGSHAQAPGAATIPARQAVTFDAGGHELRGILFRPQGDGPFPAVIWNHGSEKSPGSGPEFESVASIFVPAGYVVFAPVRRGHGFSKGQYILDVIQQTKASKGADAAARMAVHLLETEQLDDELAGLGYAKQLPFVDPNRIAVTGCSFGGIETLLGAERNAGYKAAVAISPAALSWNGNPYLQKRLIEAVRAITIPVLLLQPPKDASLEPSRVLGAEAKRLGKPFTVKVYPSTGPENEKGHCFGGAKGFHVWGEDAKAFLATHMH